MTGPSAAVAAPMPDHRAIDFVLACPVHNAAISAKVVGYAIPAAKPPMIRAPIRISTVGAKPATTDAGMASSVPMMSIILRPWRSPTAPNHNTDAAKPKE